MDATASQKAFLILLDNKKGKFMLIEFYCPILFLSLQFWNSFSLPFASFLGPWHILGFLTESLSQFWVTASVYVHSHWHLGGGALFHPLKWDFG